MYYFHVCNIQFFFFIHQGETNKLQALNAYNQIHKWIHTYKYFIWFTVSCMDLSLPDSFKLRDLGNYFGTYTLFWDCESTFKYI